MRRIIVPILVLSCFLMACAPPPVPSVAPTSVSLAVLSSTPTNAPTEPARTRRVVPTREPVTPQLLPGFHLTIVYDDLTLPTSIATDGKFFYVSEFKSESVFALRDRDGDGILETKTVFADGFNAPRGLAVHPKTGALFVSSRGKIHALRDLDDDGRADEKKLIVDDLADFDISHSNNGIAFDAFGEKLYIADGAPRVDDLSKQGDTYIYQNKPLHKFAGTILSANADGSAIQIFARGFRNPFDLTFDQQGDLFATDNGEDTLAGEVQGDELNLIVRDGDYGYPTISGPPPAGSSSVAPLINFPSHTSPNGIVFYTGERYPEKYRNQLYLALYQEGRKIVRAFQNPTTGKWEYTDFITNLDRPIDLIQGADGLLYFLDMHTGNRRNNAMPNQPGILYRIDYVAPAN